MPARVTRADRVLLRSGTAVFVGLIAVASFLARGGVGQEDAPTTYSARSKGAKAAYLLLKGSGYRTERWERAPADLPDPANTTLILADPIGVPQRDDLAALRAFMTRGGRVIATGQGGARFLSGSADFVFAGPPVVVPAVGASRITRAAPSITITPAARWTSATLTLPLYGDDRGAAVVMTDVGHGESIWWADATPLSNAGLRDEANLEFFLACLGPAADRLVLWDEYFHGYRYSIAGSLWRSQARWLVAQAAVIALAVLVTYSRRSGPIVIPIAPSRLSPLEFVSTLGSLYQRAGATTVAVDIGCERLRSRLSRQLGLREAASTDHLVAAAERYPGMDARALGDTLRACDAARGGAPLRAKAALALTQSLSRHLAALQVYSHPGRNI